MRAATALALPLLLIAAPAFASTGDTQLWITLAASFKASPSVTASFDVSERFRSDGVGGDQTQVRAFLEGALSKTVSVGGGMVYATSAASKELRPTQYLTLSHGILSARTMLEERFFSGPGQVGLRLRERVQARIPMGKTDRLNLWAETFFVLKPTVAGKPKGFDQIRFGISDEHRLTKHVSVTASYMLTVRDGKGNPDQHSNVVQLTLSWKG